MSQPRPPRRFDERWRLSRAGIVNVWFYLDNEFTLSGGRMILRGTNGSGKSRALEMLLPFLLDADRRRMDATGAARVSDPRRRPTLAPWTTDPASRPRIPNGRSAGSPGWTTRGAGTARRARAWAWPSCGRRRRPTAGR